MVDGTPFEIVAFISIARRGFSLSVFRGMLVKSEIVEEYFRKS